MRMFGLTNFFRRMRNPYADSSYIPFNQVMTRPFGMGLMNFQPPTFGNATNLRFRRTFINSGGLQNNIFANSNINVNGLNLRTASRRIGNRNVHFTGITNPYTGTKIAQLSGSNGISNFTKTRISGNDIESVGQATRNINNPFFNGTQSVTRVEDSDKIYTIRHTKGTSWIA